MLHTVRIGDIVPVNEPIVGEVSRRTRQLAAEGHSESAAALLSDAGRCSSKDAHTASERETICGVMPSFEDALATGAVSAAHVDALAAATRNLNDQLLAEFIACEADLLTDAGNQGVDTFERGCRDLARHIAAQARANSDADELDEQRKSSSVRRWNDKLTGMCKTLLSLDPVRNGCFRRCCQPGSAGWGVDRLSDDLRRVTRQQHL